MWGKISIIAYLASLTNLLMMLFHFNPFHWDYQFILYIGVFVMGLLGFIFSIISNFFDASKKGKSNKIQTFILYIGMITIFLGLFSLMQKWSFTYILFGIGLSIMTVSFFIKMEKPKGDDDILDS